MSSPREISAYLEKKLASLKRDGAAVIEASSWLVEGGLLSGEGVPAEYLRENMRTGRISGAYQLPNKRWVVVNRSRLPDGIKRVVPLKEASRTLGISESTIRQNVKTGGLKPLDFGASLLLFHENTINKFARKTIERPYQLYFPGDTRTKPSDIDKLRRQLYYLRSDIRLIAERIEELIKLLD